LQEHIGYVIRWIGAPCVLFSARTASACFEIGVTDVLISLSNKDELA